jgi:hypothetical protein
MKRAGAFLQRTSDGEGLASGLLRASESLVSSRSHATRMNQPDPNGDLLPLRSALALHSSLYPYSGSPSSAP